jgi:alkylhydroperoxidase/carboxymuconolactone decarboxylase family protein YurZ
VCSSRRFKDALDDGITKEELIELSDFVALTNAGVVARTALTSWDDEADAKCADGTCSVS